MDPIDDPNADDNADLSVMPGDLGKRTLALYGDLAASHTRQSDLRQRQLQQATDMLKQRRYAPSLAEQLFALSSAFAQPVWHRGLGSVLGNVMPVAGKIAADARTGQTAQQNELMDLQNKYATAGAAGDEKAIQDRINLLKVQASLVPKAQQPVIGSDTLGRGVTKYDKNTGKASLVRFDGEGGADTENLPVIASPADAAKLPPGTKFKTPDGKIRVVPGGPTASQSGGF